jgi:beta-lactamase regulating signal transducer with metallopeptidase domain
MRANRPAVASVLSASAVVGMCMVMSPIAGHPAGWLVSILAALAAGLAVLLASVAWRAYRHHQLSLRLGAAARPASVAQVEVREVAGLESAFVAGLFRPQIYCSPQLAAKLRPEELRAVILHERYHQLDRAPARMVVLQAIAPALRPFQTGRVWLARWTASLEIAADQHALQQGSSRGALAGALLKLAPAEAGGIGFTSATELRLQALVEEASQVAGPPRLAWLIAPVVAVIGCLLMLMPHLAR